MKHTCKTCDSCVSITETSPYGQCLFFVKPRNVNVNKDTCPNHSVSRDEERQLLESYYKSKRRK